MGPRNSSRTVYEAPEPDPAFAEFLEFQKEGNSTIIKKPEFLKL